MSVEAQKVALRNEARKQYLYRAGYISQSELNAPATSPALPKQSWGNFNTAPVAPALPLQARGGANAGASAQPSQPSARHDAINLAAPTPPPLRAPIATSEVVVVTSPQMLKDALSSSFQRLRSHQSLPSVRVTPTIRRGSPQRQSHGRADNPLLRRERRPTNLNRVVLMLRERRPTSLNGTMSSWQRYNFKGYVRSVKSIWRNRLLSNSRHAAFGKRATSDWSSVSPTLHSVDRQLKALDA